MHAWTGLVHAQWRDGLTDQPHFITLARHLRRTFTHQEHRMFSTLIADLTPSWPSQIDVTIDIHVRR